MPLLIVEKLLDAMPIKLPRMLTFLLVASTSMPIVVLPKIVFDWRAPPVPPIVTFWPSSSTPVLLP